MKEKTRHFSEGETAKEDETKGIRKWNEAMGYEKRVWFVSKTIKWLTPSKD